MLSDISTIPPDKNDKLTVSNTIMTRVKKHISPDNQSRECSATTAPCRYEGSTEHFYYDTTIQRKVLAPNHPMQKRIDLMNSQELAENAHELVSESAASTDEFKSAHADYQKSLQDLETQREKIIASYDDKFQFSVRLLAESSEGPAALAVVDIFDPEAEDGVAKSTASEEEKMRLAKAAIMKTKAEDKLRALISASHVS